MPRVQAKRRQAAQCSQRQRQRWHGHSTQWAERL